MRSKQSLAQFGHELKNPLGAVLGFAHLMATDPTEPLTEGQRRHLELIEHASRHMLSIIDHAVQAAVRTHRERAIGSSMPHHLRLAHDHAEFNTLP